jgi:hypothetical protein
VHKGKSRAVRSRGEGENSKGKTSATDTWTPAAFKRPPPTHASASSRLTVRVHVTRPGDHQKKFGERVPRVLTGLPSRTKSSLLLAHSDVRSGHHIRQGQRSAASVARERPRKKGHKQPRDKSNCRAETDPAAWRLARVKTLHGREDQNGAALGRELRVLLDCTAA